MVDISKELNPSHLYVSKDVRKKHLILLKHMLWAPLFLYWVVNGKMSFMSDFSCLLGHLFCYNWSGSRRKNSFVHCIEYLVFLPCYCFNAVYSLYLYVYFLKYMYNIRIITRQGHWIYIYLHYVCVHVCIYIYTHVHTHSVKHTRPISDFIYSRIAPPL